ncbi:MAG: lipoprotein [Motiliproteus sp.]|nr:lipoprotein [Motiliproteus sp.]MCW9051440.1 lipoprotein [Motiliproteus sp.]
MFRWFPALILGLFLLAGCGQKGDLYLPEQPPKEQS